MIPLNIAIKISKSPFLLCFISENENSVKGISAKEQKRNKLHFKIQKKEILH